MSERKVGEWGREVAGGPSALFWPVRCAPRTTAWIDLFLLFSSTVAALQHRKPTRRQAVGSPPEAAVCRPVVRAPEKKTQQPE